MSETAKTIIAAAVTLIVTIAGIFGLTIDAGLAEEIVSAIVVLVATAIAIWRNYNFTDAAQQAQVVLDNLKAEKTTQNKDTEVHSAC